MLKKSKHILTEEEKIQRQAASRGCYIVYPKENELFIDIDSDTQMHMFLVRYFYLHIYLKVIFCETNPSPSGLPERKHITLTLSKSVSNLRRIFYQFILGSDWRREWMSLKLLIKGYPYPTRFFEKNPNDLPQ